MATKAEERVAKLEARLAAASRIVKRQKAMASERSSAKAKQCAMITFNVLRKMRPDVLAWVEIQLTREQDKRAFTEWRALDQAPAAEPSSELSLAVEKMVSSDW